MRRARTRSIAVTIALVALLALVSPPTRAQDQLWLHQFGTNLVDRTTALASDDAGGVIVAGISNGGLGGMTWGIFNSFVARYDNAGSQLWFRHFGTSSGDWVEAMTPDGSGGAVAVGWTSANLGGPSAGMQDAFVVRYDGDGNQFWIRQFGSVSADSAAAVAYDGAGGVIIAGNTFGSLGGPSAGSYDSFLARYDGAGSQLWIRQFGSSGWETTWALASDGAGGVMVAGSTSGNLGGVALGGGDAFLAHFDGDGNQLWIRQFGTGQPDAALALVEDGAGGVVIAGRTQGNLGGRNAGEEDAFLAHYDAAGNQLWISQFGTNEDDYPNALAPDGAGGVMVAGFTQGDLNGGPPRGRGAFLARFDSAGDQLWALQFGTDNPDLVAALSADGVGGVMVGGSTAGDLGAPPAGADDAFLARFSIESCFPDCTQASGVGVLDIFDFLCFQNSFVNGETYACDCDTSTGVGVCDVFDFLCFQNAFVSGCP